MKFLLLLSCVFVVLVLGKKEVNKTTYHKEVLTSVNVDVQFIEFLRKNGIRFPRVAYAQSLLETGYFSSKIFKENGNLFGMKPSFRNKFEKRNGHAGYRDVLASVQDYRTWQIRLLNGKTVSNEEEYLRVLDDYNVTWCPDCSYAEDPLYIGKIKKILKTLPTEYAY